MFLKLTYYINNLSPGGPIPHNMAKTSDGPPTLERSGSEHRVGRFPSSRLRFLSPANGGTEGGVKTIEERLGEKGGAFFNGKEGRVGFRKNNTMMMNNFKDIKVAVTSTGTIPVWML